MNLKNIDLGNGIPKICVPVMEKSRQDIIDGFIESAKCEAELIEWRLDAFDSIEDSAKVLSVLDEVAEIAEEKVLLVTIRSSKEGGLSDLTEDKLEELLLKIADSEKADLIDVEYFEHSSIEEFLKKLHEKGAKVVTSYHNFDETPDTDLMSNMLFEMKHGGADVVKIAVMPKNAVDVLALLKVTNDFYEENIDTPIISMSMGSLGAISRMTGELFGSAVTFASLNKSSAPGQLMLSKAIDELQFMHEVLN